MTKNNPYIIEKKQGKPSGESHSSRIYNLILYNDNFHTFDYVIDALINICEQDSVQATQCAMLTHYKGKCDIYKGSYSSLKPMKNAFIEKELMVTIDPLPTHTDD